MCQFCHIEGNNPFAIQHLTSNCQDSRNPYTKESQNAKEGRITRTLRQQFIAQEQRAMMSQPTIRMGLTPFGPVLIGPQIPQSVGFVPVMTSPGNISFMPVFR